MYEIMVISREIRPLAALYPPPYKKYFKGLRSRASISISALTVRRWRYAHAYGSCALFYCISLKNNYGTLPKLLL